MFGKSLVGCCGATPVDLTEGLVAHYLLNNNADDCFSSYDGTTYGALDFQGDVGKFDGVDDYVNLTTFTPTYADVKTVNVFINRLSPKKIDVFSIGQYVNVAVSTNTYAWLDCRIDEFGYIWAAYGEAAGNFATHVISNIPITYGVSNHIVFQFSGDPLVTTDFKIFLNGVDVSSPINIAPFNGITATGYARIGNYSRTVGGAISNFVNGTLSNLRVYNEIKNQTFINALYVEGYYPKTLVLPTTTNLISYYPLTGTAEDKHGNIDGTEFGNTYVDDAEYGAVGNFNGTSGYIGVPTNKSNAIGTVSVWFKASSLNISLMPIWAGFMDISPNYYYLTSYINNKKLVVKCSNSPSVPFYTLQTTADLPTGKWVHIVVQSTGSLIKVYLDGVLQTLTTVAGLNSGQWFGNFPMNTFAISKVLIASTNYYAGAKQIRMLRDYTRDLTQQEITDLYNYEKNFRDIDIDNFLSAYYPLKENSMDNYRNQYNGTDTTMTYDGLSGVFNGTTSRISLSTSILPMIAADFTFSAWVKCNTVSILNRVISMQTGTYNRFFTVSFNADNTISAYYHGSTFAEVKTPYIPNKYYHIVATMTGTILKLYLNGIFIGEASVISPSYIEAAEVLYIGCSRAGNSEFLDGKISKLRLQSTSLSLEQIKVIYNTEKGDFGL